MLEVCGVSDQLRRKLRDPEPRVWKDACTVLGRQAVHDVAAQEELRHLLDCPYGELRLRGVAALAALAEREPDGTREFIHQCLQEPALERDSVLADALFTLLGHLPEDDAHSLLEAALYDPRETVRAAVACSLGQWCGWPVASLLRLARDPSPLVRCTLALSLPALRHHDTAEEAIEVLRQSPEEYVRLFVEEALAAAEKPSVRSSRPAPAQDAWIDASAVTERLSKRLDEPDCRVRLVINAEELFCRHPLDVLEIVHPLLDRPGILSLLDQVAWLARDPHVAALCRTLHAVLQPGVVDGEQRLRDLRHALVGQRGRRAAAFRAWADECHAALTAHSMQDLERWARRVSPYRYGPLLDLVTVVEAQHGSRGLENALSNMQGVSTQIQRAYAMPERHLVLMVAESWSELLHEELARLTEKVAS